MTLPHFYLPGCYALASLYFTLLFWQAETLSYRDVLVFILTPITLPLTMIMRLAALVIDLDAPCFGRRP